MTLHNLMQRWIGAILCAFLTHAKEQIFHGTKLFLWGVPHHHQIVPQIYAAILKIVTQNCAVKLHCKTVV